VRPAYSNTAVEIYFPAFLSPSLNVDIAQMQVEKGIMNQSKDRESMILNLVIVVIISYNFPNINICATLLF